LLPRPSQQTQNQAPPKQPALLAQPVPNPNDRQTAYQVDQGENASINAI